MGHQIDSSKGFNAFVSFAKPAWHGLGTVLTDAVSTEDALQKGGLDFTVLKMPNIHQVPDLSNPGEFLEIISEDSFFTFRTDTSKVLGTRLGKDYTVLQNMEALNVVDEILQSGTATIETAGVLNEGRRVFICLKMKKDIIVGSSDKVEQFVLITNGHDGSLAITAMQTNVRVVCANTVAAALRGTEDKIKIRHTTNAKDRLNEAAKVLKLIAVNTDVNQENYNTMLETVISPETMYNYFGNVFFSPDEIKRLQQGEQAKEVLSTRKQNSLNEVVSFARSGQGQSLTTKGNEVTMWTAYNAVTGYVTRKKYSSADDRANSMLFGSAAATIHDAGVLALEPKKIQPLHKISFGNTPELYN